jgi:hypothetical protein
MADVLTIGGSSRSLRANTLRIQETANGRNRLTCDVVSMDASYRPAENDVITFARDGTTLFGGIVQEAVEVAVDGHASFAGIVTRVRSVDYNVYFDWRQVALTLPAGTLKSMLQILEGYLTNYGVTLDASQAVGPTISSDLPFEFGPLTAIMDKLALIASGADDASWVYEIDYDKTLRMFKIGSSSAVSISGANLTALIGDVEVRPSIVEYANKLIVRFTESAHRAYAFLAITDNFDDGETVTIGSRTYTFQDTLTDSNGNVQIGGSADDSFNNLIAAIVLGGGAGSAYAASTTVHPSVTAYAQSSLLMKCQALSAGAAGNSIGVSESTADATWITEGGIEVSSLALGSDDALTNIAIAENTSEQAGGANLVERIVDAPEIRDLATATTYAAGLLARALITPKTITYEIGRTDLHPGMQQSLVIAARNLNGNALLTDVEIRMIGHRILRSRVTAVMGVVMPTSFRETFIGWSRGVSSAGLAIASVTSGPTTVLSSPFFLGGTDQAAVPMAGTPAYSPVLGYVPYFATATFTALVRVWLWARSGGVTITARLRNVTDSTTAGTSSGVAATSRPSSPQSFSAAIASGKEYRLEIVSDSGSEAGYGIGSLEAA